MSVIAPQGEQSTTSEIAALTALAALAITPANQMLVKTGQLAFGNIAVPGTLTLKVNSVNAGSQSILNLKGGTNITLTDDGSGGITITGPATGTGSVTSVSVTTANGVSGTVATATTTPAITLTLGAITPTTVNGLTISTSSGTLTITNSKTLSVSNSLTLAGTDGKTLTLTNGLTVTTNDGTLAFGAASKTLTVNKILTLDGTDSTTMTFPSTSATIARTDAGQTFTGVQIFTSPKIITQISDTNGNILVNIGATGSAVNYVKITNAITGTAGPIVAADGETNVDLKIAAKGTGAVHATTGSYGDLTAYSPAGAGTATLTLNTSNVHTITMPAGNITIALSNEHVGQIFTIRILQDSGGSRTVTWFTTIKWAGGVAPTLTTTASKADTFVFIVTSAGNYDGYIVGQNV